MTKDKQPDGPSGAPPRVKQNLRVKASLEVFFTGGSVAFSRTGKHLACACGDEVKVLDANTGAVAATLPGDGEAVTAIAFAVDGQSVFAASRSLTNRRFALPDGRVTRSWRGHSAPVLDMALDASGSLLATASADGSARVWDVDAGHCTHAFRGHNGLVLRACFHPDASQPRLATCGDDGTVRLWDLVRRSCSHVMRDHTAAVTGMCFADGGRLLFTSGRDSVVHCYLTDEGRLVGAIPTYEAIEGVAVLHKDSRFPGSKATAPTERKGALRVVTVGERGQVKVWDHLSGQCMYEQPPPITTGASATYADLLPVPHDPDCVLAITSDERMLIVGPTEGAGEGREAWADERSGLSACVRREWVGNVGEVTDVRLVAVGGGEEPTHVTVATSAETVRLHRLATLEADVSFRGHTDAVLGLDVHKRRVGGAWRAAVATGGKDAGVRVWDAETGACLAIGEGHLSAVSAVAFSPTGGLLASVGSDKLLKMWDTKAVLKAWGKVVKGGGASQLPLMDPKPLTARSGVAAHDRDVNCVAIGPTGVVVATGGQDKLCKIWDAETLTLTLTLRGHKRGVWGVCFSPIDRVVATSSGDRTVRLWSLRDGACLKTLEGHNGSVMRSVFVSQGTQLLTCSADGLLKLWSSATGECTATFDRHSDRIWAVDAGGAGDGVAVTGGADAAVRVWEDCTAEDDAEKTRQEAALVAKEQALGNAMRGGHYAKAARLALELGHPGRMREVVGEVLGTEGGDKALEGLCGAMGAEHVRVAMGWAREWNTSHKHCHVAQALLRAILATHPPYSLQSMPGARDIIEGLLAYSKRHMARMDRAVRSTYVLDYVLARMAVLQPEGKGVLETGAEGGGGEEVGEGGDAGEGEGVRKQRGGGESGGEGGGESGHKKRRGEGEGREAAVVAKGKKRRGQGEGEKVGKKRVKGSAGVEGDGERAGAMRKGKRMASA